MTIISASYRTDIPALYGAWFAERWRQGTVRVARPYGGSIETISLAPADVDAFVFWTRNAQPFLPVLEKLRSEHVCFVIHFTVTGYSRAIDRATIDADSAVSQIRDLARRFPAGSLVWRYDPIVLTSLTPPDWHARTFSSLCERLAGAVDEVVVSFLQPYRKTRRNMTAAANEAGFIWSDPPIDEKKTLFSRLASTAAGHGVRPTLCGQRELLVGGLADARCIDPDRLARVANRPVPAGARAHRKACGCASSKDIGAYDSCPQGCTYCYAVSGRAAAKRRLERHDIRAAELIPPAKT